MFVLALAEGVQLVPDFSLLIHIALILDYDLDFEPNVFSSD